LLADIQNPAIQQENKKFSSLLHKINIQHTSEFLNVIGLTGPHADNPFLQQLTETGIASKIQHFSNLTHNSKEFYLKLTAELVVARNEKYTLITAEDVTNEHESNAIVLDKIDRMNQILESSGSGSWDWDIPSRTVNVNKYFSKMLGHKKLNDDEVVSFFIEKIHPDDKIALHEMYINFTRGRLSSVNTEFRMKHRNGEWIWIHGRGKITARSTDGKPLRMIGINTVIQQKKQQEAKLIYQQKFEALLQKITLSFINIEPSESDNAICESLTRVSEFIDSNYACTALLNQKGDYIQITHTAVLPVDIKNDNGFNDKAFRFDADWVDPILNNKITNISASNSLLTIPEFFTQLMLKLKINSISVIPIINNQKLYGILIFGFENIDIKTLKLSEQHFTTFASIILKVLLQKDATNKKIEAQQLSELKTNAREKALRNLNKNLQHEIGELSIRNTDLQKFEILAEQSDSAVLITNLHLDSVYTNIRFTKLFGKKMHALHLFSELADHPDKKKKIIDRLSQSGGISNQLTYIKSANSLQQPFIINAKILKDVHESPVYFSFTLSGLHL
jgi:PAS domain S-box-containing protein